MKIVFATGNKHKLQEIKGVYDAYDWGEYKPLIEFVLPEDGFDPIENGQTFEENSLIKAKEAFRVSKTISLADDAGLCVEALNGAPGLHSARYAPTQDEKIEKLLSELQNIENRKAEFVCCMTLLNSNGEMVYQTTGKCQGLIATQRQGNGGFGYDPIFIPNGYNCTIAELSEATKNQISHRYNALKNVFEFIKTSQFEK